MALQSSGSAISASDINTEMQRTSTTSLSLDENKSRLLSEVSSGQISFSNFYSKTYKDGSSSDRAAPSAAYIKSLTGTTTNGIYWIKPGTNTTAFQVYCDMNTDGGGWMLLARSHPATVNYGGQNWGWRGGAIGGLTNFSEAYQSGWLNNWGNYGATFTQFLFGNRANVNNNNWGSFIYKRYDIDYNSFLNSDTQQYYSYTTIQSDTGVYGSTGTPGMQGAIGYATTGTNNNLYYMRDCCGFSGYGGYATSMNTTYCGSDGVVYYSGPWCGGNSTDGSGNFLSGTYLTTNGNRYGGTNQYMIMVK